MLLNKTLLSPLAALLVFSGISLADQPLANPIGRALKATQNTFVFAYPPSGFSGKAKPVGILGVASDGSSQYFPMMPKAGDPSNYVLQDPVPIPDASATVTEYRDILQGHQTNRWLKFETRDGSGRKGWILWGEVNSSNDALQWQN